MRACEEHGCTREAVVGLNGSWYCIDHFEARLADIGKQMKQLGRLFNVRLDEP